MEQIFFNLETTLFVTVIALNLVKKNSHLVFLYSLQSLIVVGLLALEGVGNGSAETLLIALIVLFIKVFFAPYFFYRFVRKSRLNLATSTYMSTPQTLIILTAIIFISNSDIFQPLAALIGTGNQLAMMLISSTLNSIFILINRKGSLAQIIGILCLENTIVTFGLFLKLSQTFIMEIGILFDILVWIVLAIIFVELLYKRLKITDVTSLNKLTE